MAARAESFPNYLDVRRPDLFVCDERGTGRRNPSTMADQSIPTAALHAWFGRMRLDPMQRGAKYERKVALSFL